MRPMAIFIAVVLAVSLPAQVNMGDLFNKAKKVKETAEKVEKVADTVRPINEEEEYYIGRSVSAHILDKYNLLKNETLTAYINLIGLSLVINSERPEIFNGYHFAVLNSDEFNAYAAPGGIVFLTRALVQACENEDQLASVIAHEICHVVAKHPLGAIRSNRMKELAGIGMDELTKGSAQVVDLFKDSVMDISSTLLINGYSSSQEQKADLAALELLQASGYAPMALLSMLHKLESREVKKSKVYATHPRAADRCRYIAKTLKQMEPADESMRASRFRKTMTAAGL